MDLWFYKWFSSSSLQYYKKSIVNHQNHQLTESTIWYDNQTKISYFVTECDAALKSFKLERRRSRRWCYITKRNRNFGSIPPFRRVWTLRFQCNKPYYTASSTLGTFWMGKSIKIIGIWPAYVDLDIEWHSSHLTDLARVPFYIRRHLSIRSKEPKVPPCT